MQNSIIHIGFSHNVIPYPSPFKSMLFSALINVSFDVGGGKVSVSSKQKFPDLFIYLIVNVTILQHEGCLFS